MLARPVRFLAGIGGYGILALIPGWGPQASWAFALVLVVAALTTVRGRGLPGLLTGRQLADDRGHAFEHGPNDESHSADRPGPAEEPR